MRLPCDPARQVPLLPPHSPVAGGPEHAGPEPVAGDAHVTGRFKTSHSWALQNQPPLLGVSDTHVDSNRLDFLFKVSGVYRPSFSSRCRLPRPGGSAPLQASGAHPDRLRRPPPGRPRSRGALWLVLNPTRPLPSRGALWLGLNPGTPPAAHPDGPSTGSSGRSSARPPRGAGTGPGSPSRSGRHPAACPSPPADGSRSSSSTASRSVA